MIEKCLAEAESVGKKGSKIKRGPRDLNPGLQLETPTHLDVARRHTAPIEAAIPKSTDLTTTLYPLGRTAFEPFKCTWCNAVSIDDICKGRFNAVQVYIPSFFNLGNRPTCYGGHIATFKVANEHLTWNFTCVP